MDLSAINKPVRISLIVIFAIILAIVSYLFFVTFTPLLSSTKLLVFDLNNFIGSILLPLILLIILIVILTYALAITKSYFVVVCIPIAFLISQNFNLISILIAVVMLGTWFMFAKYFFDDLDNFKRPSITRCINISFGFPLTLLSLILVLNFYPLYSNFVNSNNIQIDQKFADFISQVSQEFSGSGQDITPNETLREFAINTLHKQNVPITDKNIQLVEDQVKSQLGVEIDESEKITDVQSRALLKRFEQMIQNNRTLALVIIIFAYFLLAQSFIKFGAWLSGLFILIIESILNVFNVKFFPEYIAPQQQ